MGTPGEWENVEQAAMEAQIEPQPAPKTGPKTGLIPLKAVDVEAIKALSAEQRLLQNALNAFLAPRWRAVELEVLEEAPPGARVTNWDLDQGVAAWEVKP